MKKVGIIDLGSMTIRLVIFELLSDSTFKIIEDIKENTYLAKDSEKTMCLDSGEIKKATHSIYLYKELARKYKVDELKCYVSSTYKNYRNSKKLLSAIEKESKVAVELLNEEKEVEASFIGAINNLEIDEGVLLDMGGRRTKLVWFENRKIKKWCNLPLGSITLNSLVDLKKMLSEDDEIKLKEVLRNQLKSIEWLDKIESLPVVGIGAPMRNLAKVHGFMCEYPLNILHNYQIKEEDLEEVYELIKNKTYKEKLQIKGLSPARAKLFTGELFIIEEILSHSKTEKIIISGNGMREGMVYSNYLKVFESKEEIFENSLSEIMEKFNLPREDGERNYKVFKKIYDKIQKTHKINIRDDRTLKTACYLGRAGININFYDHPIHSLYMILNSGLKGLSHRDLLIAALIVSEQSDCNDLYKRFEDLLGKKDINCIKKLSTILKVVKLLNGNFLVENEDFKVEVKEKKIILGLENKSLLDAQLGKFLLSKDMFKELFNKDLVISAV